MLAGAATAAATAGTALNQGSLVGSGFSGAFKCFRSCLECRKRLSETEAETGFLIGAREKMRASHPVPPSLLLPPSLVALPAFLDPVRRLVYTLFRRLLPVCEKKQTISKETRSITLSRMMYHRNLYTPASLFPSTLAPPTRRCVG